MLIIPVLLVALVLLIVVIALRPAEFSVRRSLVMSAPPERIYGEVVDFRRWAGWSPWEGVDPAARRTFGPVPAGVGATTHWAGNKQVGEGRMTCTEARPGEHIGIRIEFIKPFTATNRVDFDFVPVGGGTQVTWAMSGRNGFLGKAMGLLFNCEKMVGDPFEKGLAELKRISEAAG